MKYFVRTVIIGCLAVAAFTFWADPSHRWHRNLVFAYSNLGEGEAWVVPQAGYDERKLKTAHFKLAKRADVLVLGSSRAMQISTSFLQPGKTLFNLGVSGASIEDYLAFWQLAKEENKIPEYVLIYADPWILNVKRDQNRWVSNKEYFESFLQGVQPQRRNFLELFQSRIRELANEGADLLSWISLKAAWDFFQGWQMGEAVASEGGVLPENKIPANKSAYLYDGSYRYPAKTIEPKASAAIRQIASEYYAGKSVYSLDQYANDSEAMKQFKSLLTDLKAHAVKTMIILPPYQPETYRGILAKPGYQTILPQFAAAMESLAVESSETHLCDQMDPTRAGCLGTEFFDGMHALVSCERKVLARCLGLHAEWAKLARGKTF